MTTRQREKITAEAVAYTDLPQCLVQLFNCSLIQSHIPHGQGQDDGELV